ncbi:MAG: hypothetical protein JRJ59_04545 [Deltaproteobacteria bacterium]|nr:hypothetical protein [Deltaproteobacteria bacterium]
MPVLEKITLDLSPGEVLTAIGRGQPLDKFEADVEWALEEAGQVWQPAALIDYFPKSGVEAEQVRVFSAKTNQEVSLKLGPKADLLAPAEEVQVSISTIGPGLDQRIRELQAQGHSLRSYLLDSVGVVALGQVGQAVRQRAEARAADRGWGVSPSLSPGSLMGWPLEGQKVLTSLLDLDQVGVSLSPSCVLIPLKSASAAIGLGPTYQDRRVGSVCRWCVHAPTCWRRRDD